MNSLLSLIPKCLLLSVVAQAALQEVVDRLVIAVHPHENIYADKHGKYHSQRGRHQFKFPSADHAEQDAPGQNEAGNHRRADQLRTPKSAKQLPAQGDVFRDS